MTSAASTALQDLRLVALGGADPPPILAPARPVWLRRLVRGGLAVLALPMVLAAFDFGNESGGLTQLLWAASVAPLALVGYRPLLAWRIAWVTALLAMIVGVGPTAWATRDLPVPTDAPYQWFAGQILVLLVVLFAVGTVHRPGMLLWVGAATITLAAFGLQSQGVPTMLVANVGSAMLVAGLLALGHQVQRRTRTQQRLAAAQERGAVLTERARIARELHDVVAHRVSMIAVRAETAPYRLEELPETARTELAEISQASRQALTEMRRLLGVLRSDEPAPLTAPQPGLADLAELVATARAAGADATLALTPATAALPAAVDVSAYRIVQEALTNAARHAPGAPIQVVVNGGPEALAVCVRNGPGRSRPAPPAGAGRRAPDDAVGHGVQGMRERAAMLGGELRAGPTPDGGFDVSATLPLRAAA